MELLSGVPGQKGGAAFQNIGQGGFKVAGVPGVGNVTGVVGQVQQAAHLALRVAAQNAQHVAHVGAVHAQEQVVLAVVLRRELDGPLARRVDAVPGENPPGAGMDAVANLLPAGGGGGHGELRPSPLFFRQISEEELRHGGAADVTVANKKYFYHLVYIPSQARTALIVRVFRHCQTPCCAEKNLAITL